MEDRTTALLVYPYTLKKVSDRKGSAVVFIREKKTDCANYREVDIIPRTEAAEQAARGKRGKKRKVNAPKQKDLNDKNAKRYLVQLGNGNFHIGEMCIRDSIWSPAVWTIMDRAWSLPRTN